MRPVHLEIAVCVLLILIAVGVVTSTHRVFNETLDEPIHVAAGYNWLNSGDYTLDIEHPPLSRIAGAFPLWVRGIEPPVAQQWVARGNEILNQRGHYMDDLGLARSGELVFLVALLVVVWLWTRHIFSPAHAVVAVFMLAVLPPVLAHAGLVTTDVAATATFAAALAALDLYLENRSWRNAVLLGLAIGLGAGAKFSFVVFFPCCASILVAAFLWRRRHASSWWSRAAIEKAATVAGLALLVVWSLYRFDFGLMAKAHPRGQEMIYLGMHDLPARLLQPIVESVPIPAPLFADGILEVKLHNERGHFTYFAGHNRHFGVWYYFPTILLLKTPFPLLLLALVGAFAMRSRPEIALLPLGVLLPAMTARINIGIRHILPIYPLLAIIAAHGAITLWRTRSKTAMAAVVALLSWNVYSTVVAYPDYIPWFNEAAGAHPERIVADSNIDWGQDVLRFADFCRAHKVASFGNAIFTSCDLDKLPLPPRHPVTRQTRGWIAVSEMWFNGFWSDKDNYHWLDPYYVARVGHSIRVFYVP